jgi:hypothetical protein
MLCRKPIKAGDRGVVMPHIASDGWPERHYNHIDCLVGNVTGEGAHGIGKAQG